ncbi:MAG: 50S ribosomal protein L14 [Candidatus Aenigmarchaeota archaeon]|nr:50S ribosomal protein L14 [Candidatus Aenigmarchaeota archaeon]
MKPIKARRTRCLPVGAYIECADNTGAKKLQIISVYLYKGRRKRKPTAGIADLVKCTVKEGTVKWRKQMVIAVIVRTRREFRRPDGMRVKFDDNAAIMVNEKSEAVGTQIKGPIAKEVVERFSAIGKIASIIV